MRSDTTLLDTVLLPERHLLAEAQGALVRALRADSLEAMWAAAPANLRPMPGISGGLVRSLNAYRLNGVALAERALAAAYPRLRQVMEIDAEGSFVALAWACWRREGPTEPDVGRWGEVLVRMLDDAVARAGLPMAWADLARVEWARHLAERQDEQPLDAASLALLNTESADRLRLCLQPSLAVFQLSDASLLRDCACASPVAPCRPVGCKHGADAHAAFWRVSREGWRAVHVPVDPATGRWLLALRADRSLEQALLDAGETFDLSQWLPQAIKSGWITGVQRMTACAEAMDARTAHGPEA